jgi:hypothetical protein
VNCYEIRVAESLDPRRAHALGCEELRLLPGGGSLLVFDAADQSALYGLLARLRNAGIELVAVHRIVAPAEKGDSGAWTDISPMEVPGVTR